MNLTKILAGLLVVLAAGLAVTAWVLGRAPERPAAPAAAAQTAGRTADAQPALHAVVVAARPVAAGQRLAAEDLKLARLPAPVADGVKTAEAAVGRTTLAALAAEAPLLEQNLVNGLSLQLEPGQRAVSIAVKENMAAGHYVRPGDFVDVFFTLDDKGNTGGAGNDKARVDSQTRLLLARSRVLAYGPANVENPPPTAAQRQQARQQSEDARNKSLVPGSSGSSGTAAAGGSNGNGGNAAAAREDARLAQAATAVLAVPLDDVERLTLAEKYGQLTLALRHPDDTSVPDPRLFATLPTALQPLAGRLPRGETLQGADRAFAGLRFKDLAAGTHAGSNPGSPRAAATPSATGRASAPAARGQSVQVYQGSSVQTVNY